MRFIISYLDRFTMGCRFQRVVLEFLRMQSSHRSLEIARGLNNSHPEPLDQATMPDIPDHTLQPHPFGRDRAVCRWRGRAIQPGNSLQTGMKRPVCSTVSLERDVCRPGVHNKAEIVHLILGYLIVGEKMQSCQDFQKGTARKDGANNFESPHQKREDAFKPGLPEGHSQQRLGA